MNDKYDEMAQEIETYPFPQLRDRFTSGNDVPVPQARLLRTEYDALLSTVRELQRELVERDNELETERLRLAVCGTAAIGYFTDCKEEYRSASLDDVLRLLKRADELQRQVAEKEADAKRYRWLRDPKSDIALVIDKLIDEPVGVYRDGSMAYEYRSGSDLDAAIDAALNTEHTG